MSGFIINPYAFGFSPASISGLRLWLDASDATTITASSNLVSEWVSKDANARVFDQPTSTSRPGTGVGTLNGRNILSFVTDDWLRSTAASSVWKFMTDGTIHHVFAVVRFGNVTNPDTRYDLYSLGQLANASITSNVIFDDRSSLSRNDTIRAFAYNGSAAIVNNGGANDTFPANTWAILQHRADIGDATAADRSELVRNGGSAINNNVTTGTPSASNPGQTLHIGCEWDGTTARFPLTGGLAEMLIYEADLTTDDVSAIEGYLAAKWGITLA